MIVPIQRADLSVIQLHFPTNARWIERQRLRKLILRPGKPPTAKPSEAFDLALLRQMAVEQLPSDVHGAEASAILNHLASSEATEIERLADDRYRVHLRTFSGATTVHELQIPDLAGFIARHNATFTRRVRLGVEEIHISLTAPAALYEAHVVSRPEFNPIPHKVGVVIGIAASQATV